MTIKNSLSAFCLILKQDLLIAYRYRLEFLNPIAFFVLIITLFPLAISTEPKILSLIAPGVIWIAALFAMVLSLENLFHSDFEEGTLEQLILAPQPLSLLILAKIMAHWVASCLPLILLSLFLAQFLYLPKQAWITLIESLLLGSPVMYLIGALGAALTVSLRNKGLLLLLLVLPLFIPVLIFSTTAVMDAANGLVITQQLLLLSALFIFASTFAPVTIAAALRISVY